MTEHPRHSGIDKTRPSQHENRENELHPENALVEKAAQVARNNPKRAIKTYATLRSNLREYMMQDPRRAKNPEAVEYESVKRVQQADIAALEHVRMTQLIAHMLPLMRDQRSLLRETDPEMTFPYLTRPFKGTYKTFLDVGVDWNEEAHETLLEAQDPNYEALLTAHARVRKDLASVSPNSLEPVQKQLTNMRKSNFIETLDTLVAWRESARHYDGAVDAETLTLTALAHTPRLALGADFGRGLFHGQVKFPHTLTAEPSDIPMGDDAYAALGYEKLFTGSGEWTNDKLNISPKKKHFCPANIPLLSPLMQDRNDAEEFFQLAEEIAGVSIDRRGKETWGKFDASTALMVFSILLAKDTIFSPSPLNQETPPPIRRRGITCPVDQA